MILTQKKRLILGIAFTLTFLFIGIISGINGVWMIVNYKHPYLFGFIFGGIGLLIGIMTYYKFFVSGKSQRFLNEFPALLCLSIGFIGLNLSISPRLNTLISKGEKCEFYNVIDKEKNVTTSSRNPKIYSLYITENQKPYRLICSPDYWNNVEVGTNIKVCFFSSEIGFDYVELADDKE